jgi:hypothetical protein
LAGGQVGAFPAYHERILQTYIVDSWTHVCKDTDGGHDRLALERWMGEVVRAENAVGVWKCWAFVRLLAQRLERMNVIPHADISMMAAPKRNVQAPRPPSLRASPFTFSGVAAFDAGASGEGCFFFSAYPCVSGEAMIDM